MQVQQNVIDPLFERKVDLVTEGLPAGYAKRLKLVSQVSQGNALTICNYIMAMKTEINPSDNYRKTNVAILTKFSKFFRNQKSFSQIRREDVLAFLDSLRKPETLSSS
jgi:outer membrane lipoprotein-sorting protein